MGDIYHAGQHIGGCNPIDDSSTSLDKLWSSQKIDTAKADKEWHLLVDDTNLADNEGTTYTTPSSAKELLLRLALTDDSNQTAQYVYHTIPTSDLNANTTRNIMYSLYYDDTRYLYYVGSINLNQIQIGQFKKGTNYGAVNKANVKIWYR